MGLSEPDIDHRMIRSVDQSLKEKHPDHIGVEPLQGGWCEREGVIPEEFTAGFQQINTKRY